MQQNNNRTLSKIFDEVARENTQGLIVKDHLLETDYATSRRDDSRDSQVEVVCSNDKSHTSKLAEGI